jgi:uncharacterized protein YqjF (DUF2071 family)
VGTEAPGAFLTADWRWLLMLHHEVSPSLLEPLVPAGTELDSFGGRHFVGLIGFRFLKTRLLGWPVPFHRNFEELNLRFYIRRRAEGRWRRGVAFVRELVPRRAVAWTARLAYGEPYAYSAMSSELVDPARQADAAGRIAYSWRGRLGEGRIAASFAGEAFPLEPGSIEEFFAEHYHGYTRRPGKPTIEYQVEHDPWTAWTAATHSAEGDWVKLYGEGFAEALRAPAVSAMIAAGSAVTVRKPVEIPNAASG